MGLLHLQGITQAAPTGQPAAKASRYIFLDSRDTLANTYKDSNLTHTQANPMIADDAGEFDLCYLVDGIYRVVTKDPKGAVLSVYERVVVGTSNATILGNHLKSCRDMRNDTLLCYENCRGHRPVQVGESFPMSEGNYSYCVVASDTSDYHIVTAGGVKLRVLSGERGYNVQGFGAVGDGVIDDTPAIQAAIDTGRGVFFPSGVYRASGLVLDTHDQKIVGTGSVTIRKNADGPIITGSGDRVGLDGLILQGGSSATPEFSGDNISVTGHGFQFMRSASYWCAGRAIKATGAHVLITDPIHTIATADTSGDGYDIEIGQYGEPTLYHRISNWYTGSFAGGLLLIDTGSHMLSNSLFGKLTIQAGTTPPGTNGGITTGCRIGGDIHIGLSNAVFTGNQPSSSGCNVTFALGTSSCRWDISNTTPASITNLGNTNNLILRETSEGSSANLSFGDDSWAAEVSISAQGTWAFPEDILMNNNSYIRVKDSSGATQLAVGLSNGDDWFFGSDTGANFTNLSSGSGGVYIAPSGTSVAQFYAGGLRPTTDSTSSLGTSWQRWSNIYATNGIINTSDAREKCDIRPLSAAEARVASCIKGLIRAFRWKNAQSDKGSKARIHIGVIAQDIRDAFSAEGLSAFDYGILCHDSWEAKPEQRDKKGNTIAPAMPAGERYGVRYEELMSFALTAL